MQAATDALCEIFYNISILNPISPRISDYNLLVHIVQFMSLLCYQSLIKECGAVIAATAVAATAATAAAAVVVVLNCKKEEKNRFKYYTWRQRIENHFFGKRSGEIKMQLEEKCYLNLQCNEYHYVGAQLSSTCHLRYCQDGLESIRICMVVAFD
ncbi:hypothetical protein T4D_5264 [Trichinella pseudospiralis]|uniref:Uncharacterized protein n=1 Tax=Trichinella pseudospiralis TaxID=6337 RepID=A0A0V1FXE2_TRIPS|nr:hypothetical protein T4D_5264 [Trichinella pseudospiralis]